MQSFTILIKNGFIVDGSGASAYRGSVGVEGERIAEIGEISCSSADIVIDAENLIVAPGFIDPHSHVDQYIFVCSTLEDYAMQGVTTVIGGNCGYSPAPVKDFYLCVGLLDARFDLRKPYMRQRGWITPWNTIIPLDEFRAKAKEIYGIDINWRSFAEFLCRIEEEGVSINFVPLVGYGNIRLAAMGLDYKRKATDAELEEMKEMAAEAMEVGALGLSTGRDYPPQEYADASEIIELARVVERYRGFYFTHYRGCNITGLHEAAEIGRKSGVPVHISHLITAYDIVTVYRHPLDVVAPKTPETLLESAAYETLNVADKYIKEKVFTSFDVVLSAVGGAGCSNYLACFLRPWLEGVGSRQTLAKYLTMQDFRKDLRQEMKTTGWSIGNYWQIRIVSCANKQYLGKTIAEICEEKNRDEIDTILDIMTEDPETRIEYSFRDENQIKINIKHPLAMPSLDKVVPIYGSWKRTNLSYELPYEYWDCYPLLSTGGFPLYFRRFVKEEKILSLEEAVRKATNLPAQIFKIGDRGILKKGAYADIVIFNYEEISDMGNSLEPLRPPKGIEYVIVNGKIVIEKNKHKGIRTGKVIRKNTQK